MSHLVGQAYWRSCVRNSVEAILCRALRLIQSKEPVAYAAIANRLEGLTIYFDFETPIFLETLDGKIVQSYSGAGSDIAVSGRRNFVLDVVYGKMTLTKAVRNGNIEVAGAIGKLTCALSAVEYFTAALLRIEDAHDLVKALEA